MKKLACLGMLLILTLFVTSCATRSTPEPTPTATLVPTEPIESVGATATPLPSDTPAPTATLAQTDTTPPAITEINVPSIDETSATITWTTDEPATSQVKYGLEDTYGKTSDIDEQLTTSHTVTLTGLKTDTVYHYRVISNDISGNETISAVDNTLKTPAPIPIGVEIGNRAPDFTLETVDGNEISLKELKGKKVIINF